MRIPRTAPWEVITTLRPERRKDGTWYWSLGELKEWKGVHRRGAIIMEGCSPNEPQCQSKGMGGKNSDLPFFLPFDLLHCFPLAISKQKPEVNGAQMVWLIWVRIEEGRKWIWERAKSE